MPHRNTSFQKPKQKSKFIEQMKLEAAKKKLHNLGMELIKEPEIKAYYTEFQKFMDWNYPLDFKIEAFSGKREGRNSWATVQPPKRPGEPYILEVDITASSVRKNDYKSLLFHEFTHIYDDLTIHERVKKNGVENPGSWYTEAHATEIELMCSCGMEEFNSTSKVNLADMMPYYGREISIAEFGSQKETEIKFRLEQKDYSGAIKHLQYYIGYLRFVKNHCCPAEAAAAKHRGTEFLQDTFGVTAIDISDILLRPYLSTVSFNRIRNLQTRLIQGLMSKNS